MEALRYYFTEMLQSTMPKISCVSVAGGCNMDLGELTEAYLDIEVAGALAPGAEIVVYCAPCFDAFSIIKAIKQATHDPNHNHCVISNSWGAQEYGWFWTQNDLDAINEALQEAAALGITTCVASGDQGATNMVPTGLDYVEFPGSSPWALCCGGTSIDVARGTIAREVVWNDKKNGLASGGGVSQVFDVPQYQQQAGLNPVSANPGGAPGRGIPDVAGCATNCKYLTGDQMEILVGTSAVAPMWAALIALLNEKAGRRLGWMNGHLYRIGKTEAFNDIVHGNNEMGMGTPYYEAKVGWDACTGWGSPNGKILYEEIMALLDSSN